jgi:hypothetical protein
VAGKPTLPKQNNEFDTLQEICARIEVNVGLSGEFCNDPAKQAQWRAFLKRSNLTETSVGLVQIVEELQSFFSPILKDLAIQESIILPWVAIVELKRSDLRILWISGVASGWRHAWRGCAKLWLIRSTELLLKVAH